MKIAIGSDHAGLELKEYITSLLKDQGIDYVDLGTDNSESVDYPDYGIKVSEAVSKKEVDRGILICGTGLGMSIVANKFRNVRATLCHDTYTARMGRLHNDSNILIIGGRVTGRGVTQDIVDTWLHTEFEGGRHERRLKKIKEIEDNRVCES